MRRHCCDQVWIATISCVAGLSSFTGFTTNIELHCTTQQRTSADHNDKSVAGSSPVTDVYVVHSLSDGDFVTWYEQSTVNFSPDISQSIITASNSVSELSLDFSDNRLKNLTCLGHTKCVAHLMYSVSEGYT